MLILTVGMRYDSKLGLSLDQAQIKVKDEYQTSGAGGTCSPPAKPHHLQNQKLPLEGPKMADGVWKDDNLKVFDRSRQFSQNKIFIQAESFCNHSVTYRL